MQMTVNVVEPTACVPGGAKSWTVNRQPLAVGIAPVTADVIPRSEEREPSRNRLPGTWSKPNPAGTVPGGHDVDVCALYPPAGASAADLRSAGLKDTTILPPRPTPGTRNTGLTQVTTTVTCTGAGLVGDVTSRNAQALPPALTGIDPVKREPGAGVGAPPDMAT
jgi:hypothetical protein